MHRHRSSEWPRQPGALRAVIADDSYLVREGVRRLLLDGAEVDVVADAATATELARRVQEHQPDAVLTDIRMPPGHGMDGILAALQIRKEQPTTGVIVLSQHADASYAQALFREGTTGLAYLLKERVGDRDELIRALRAVVAGGSVVDPLVVDALLAAHVLFPTPRCTAPSPTQAATRPRRVQCLKPRRRQAITRAEIVPSR